MGGVVVLENRKFQNEKNFGIPNGVTKYTASSTLNKKRKIIEMQHSYNYRLVDDNCCKETDSRLTRYNYRRNYQYTNTKIIHHKSNTNLIDRLNNRSTIKLASDLGEDTNLQNKIK